jgi:predicted  nucleic acid-binding Zn-ribbon protein
MSHKYRETIKKEEEFIMESLVIYFLLSIIGAGVLVSLRMSYRNSSEKVNSVYEENEFLKVEKESSSERLDLSKMINSQLGAKMKGVMKELGEYKESYVGLNLLVGELSEKVDGMRESQEIMLKNNVIMNKRYNELNDKFDTLMRDNRDLNIRFDDVMQDNINLRKENRNLQDQVRDMRQINSRVTKRLDEVEGRLKINEEILKSHRVVDNPGTVRMINRG